MSKKRTLQDHLSETGSWFCAVTHDLSLAEKIKITILDFPSWAWVFHNPDDDDGTDHIHFMMRANGTRSIKNIADKIDLPGNFIQVCRNEVGYRRYMMHLDNPEKHQYTVEDIHTNQHALFRQAHDANKPQGDIFKLYNDYCRLCSGLINPKQFLEEHYDEMEKMPFGQKIKTFQVINQEWGHHAYT